MTNYDIGDVVLVHFPQTAAPGTKLRPAVVVLDVRDEDVVVAPVTSVPRHGPGDLPITAWLQAGLHTASWVRPAKLNTLPKQDVSRRVGSLSKEDRQSMAAHWQGLDGFAP